MSFSDGSRRELAPFMIVSRTFYTFPKVSFFLKLSHCFVSQSFKLSQTFLGFHFSKFHSFANFQAFSNFPMVSFIKVSFFRKLSKYVLSQTFQWFQSFQRTFSSFPKVSLPFMWAFLGRVKVFSRVFHVNSKRRFKKERIFHI